MSGKLWFTNTSLLQRVNRSQIFFPPSSCFRRVDNKFSMWTLAPKGDSFKYSSASHPVRKQGQLICSVIILLLGNWNWENLLRKNSIFLGQLFLCKTRHFRGKQHVGGSECSVCLLQLERVCCEAQVNIKPCLVSQQLSWTSWSQRWIHTTFRLDFQIHWLLSAELCMC